MTDLLESYHKTLFLNTALSPVLIKLDLAHKAHFPY